MSHTIDALFGPSFGPSRFFSFSTEKATASPYQSYQKIKDLPAPLDFELFQNAHDERVKAKEQSRSLISKICEIASMGIDGNSLGRNATSATSTILKLGEGTAGTVVGTGVGVSAIAGGSFGFLVSLNIIRDRLFKIREDVNNRNLEGGFEHSLDASMGASYGGVSGAMVASNAAAFAGAAGVAASAGLAISVLGLAMQAFIAIRSTYGIAVNAIFKHRVTHIIEPKEKIEFMTKLVEGGSTKEELNKKWDQLAFRTSEACCRHLREYVIQKNSGVVDSSVLEKNAKIILREVGRANNKQILKHALLITIAAISATAFICGLVLAGPFAPLLFALGAVLWFMIDSSDVHEAIGNRLCGKPIGLLREKRPSRRQLRAWGLSLQPIWRPSMPIEGAGISSLRSISESKKEQTA